MSLNKVVKISYESYKLSTKDYNVKCISFDDYKSILIKCSKELIKYDNENGKEAYVMAKVGDIYMKVKKQNNNAIISYMDEEAFNVITNYKNN